MRKTAVVGRASRAGVILFLMISLFGCSTLNRQSVRQNADMELVRELMAPVYNGQQKLVETIGAADHDRIVFRIENDRVIRVAEQGEGAWMGSPENIVFFRIKGSENNPRALCYFDPQTFQLTPLPDKEDQAVFILFKSLPHDGKWIMGEQRLSLIRIKFEYNKSGEIRLVSKNRIPGIKGDAFLPVYLEKKETLFFLNRENQGANRLMSVDKDGLNLKQHLGDDGGQISRIYTEDGENLLFESDQKGYQSLFRLNPDDGSVTAYRRSGNQNTVKSRFILAGRYAHGIPSPVVVRLPETMDIKAITSLAIARNPEVNLKRALFAASLVEAGIATLPNYPSFYFELGTDSAAGLLSDQGRFFSRTLINGLAGVVQPLLDIHRNTELARAAQLAGETARNQLENEINERVAEAVQLYFEINYLNQMERVRTALMATYGERATHYAKLKTVGDAYGLQLSAAEKIIVAGRSEQLHNRERTAFLMSRLKNLCGLPQGMQVALADEDFRLDKAFCGEEAALNDLAILNHPRIKAVASELEKAYFLESASPALRGKLNIAAEYEYLGRNLDDPVQDDINLTLSGSISSVHKKAAALHGEYWKQVKDSLRIRFGIVCGQVRLSLEEALMDFKAAKNDHLAKEADAQYHLEKIRVARLYRLIDSPDEDLKKNPLAVNTAVQEYLSALARSAGVLKDLGIRYVNVCRETGLSKFIPEKIDRFSSGRIDRKRPSVWLWKTEELIGSPGKTAEFLKYAKAGNIKRVYAYLYSDSRLLAGMMSREKFTLFLNACAAEGIEVWALLGEPEWLTDQNGKRDLLCGLQRIKQYNGAKNSLEPQIRGVKLDLEPHSIPGWETDLVVRDRLNRRYIELLTVAKGITGGKMPLWVDCPVKYFTHEKNRELLGQIDRLTDGITAMVYFNSPEKIIDVSKAILTGRSGPIEIGLEFSGKAPTSDTLYRADEKERAQLLNAISDHFFETSAYAGFSFHDYSAIKTFLDMNRL